jgi:hypothetical protein
MPAKKIGKPLGGVGAERMRKRNYSLVLDDRLISKQFVTAKADAKVDNTTFASSWALDETTAPTKAAVFNKINSLSVDTSAFTQEDTDSETSKVKAFRKGNYGFGDGTDMTFANVTHKVTIDGDLRVGAIDGSNNDIYLDDGVILYKYDAGGSTAMLTLDSTNGNKSAQKFAIGSTNPSVPLEVSLSGSNATLSDGTGIAQFGADGGANLGIDANDIQARSGGGEADLYINRLGGDVILGSDTNDTITSKGHMVVEGNLTVSGTATAINTTQTTINDNIITLNNDVTGTPSENAGIEVERGDAANVALRWNESTDKWQVTTDGSSYADIVTSGAIHDAVTIDNQGTGLLSLSGQDLTVNDVMVKNSGDTMTGTLTLSGTSGGSGTTALSVTGGNSAASNPAVSITGHLSATTKSFNIPHPLYEDKRLVYGCLEGPEYGMYARGTGVVGDGEEKRMIGIELPDYWFKMVGKDYTISLTPHGNYNVWIAKKTEDGFYVMTDTKNTAKFDWSVIGGRLDAKLEVEPNA